VDNLTNQPAPVVQTQEKNKKALFFFLFTLVVCVVVLATYIFFFLNKTNKTAGTKQPERPDTDFFIVEPTTETITKVEEEPVGTVITDLDFSQKKYEAIGKILKGYYDSYDQKSAIFKVKNQLMNSNSLQLLEASTKNLKQFYCWPSIYEDKNKGAVEVKTLQFMVNPSGADMFMAGEKSISIDQLDVFLQKDSFVILQLTNPFVFGQENLVQKLIVLGC